jgi:hypothetical protein
MRVHPRGELDKGVVREATNWWRLPGALCLMALLCALAGPASIKLPGRTIAARIKLVVVIWVSSFVASDRGVAADMPAWPRGHPRWIGGPGVWIWDGTFAAGHAVELRRERDHRVAALAGVR